MAASSWIVERRLRSPAVQCRRESDPYAGAQSSAGSAIDRGEGSLSRKLPAGTIQVTDALRFE